MTIETNVAIAITALLVKLLDYLYEFFKHKIKGGSTESKLTSRIEVIEDIITKTDSDGVPLIYTPRRFGKDIDEQNNLTKSLVHSNENISRAIEKLTTVTESMIRILDKIEYRTSHLDK